MPTEAKFEIERRFVVETLDLHLSSYPCVMVEQGYTADGLRLRRIGSNLNQTYVQTIKSGQGMSRVETETNISREAFLQKWPLTAGRRLTKTRYNVPIGAYVAEVDVFGGDLSGHVIIEVEFPSEKEAEAFVVPSWFLKDGKSTEVTNNTLYNNYSLAKNGWPK